MPLAGWDDVLHVLGRNSLVLALHGFACVAGFIAGSSLPLSAERYSGVGAGSTTAPARWRSLSWWEPPPSPYSPRRMPSA